MDRRVLLVTQDEPLLRELGGALRNADDISVMECADDRKAIKQVSDFHPDVVIVSLALARDSKSPVTDLGGLEFCKAANARTSALILVITPAPVPDIVSDALAGLRPKVTYREVCTGYVARVLEQVRTAKPPPKRLDIVVEALEGNRWEYRLKGENFPYTFERTGPLNFDEGAQDLSIELAQVIGRGFDDWESSFTKLGKGIVRSLFGVDSPFAREVREGLKEVGGLSRTRVTFVVGQEQYEIALEAVFPPVAPAPKPWMIHAPLVRNIRGQAAANMPLFDGPPRAKRCLIVGANTSGFVDDVPGGRLNELPHVPSECAEVANLFRHAPRDLGFDEPLVVGIDPARPLSKNDFLGLLETPWDVIHFAGHANYSPAASSSAHQACLFVGPPGKPEPVEMSAIAPSLRGNTSLLYLSGCQTANAGFAVVAAQYGVAAVLGFRWKIKDGPAEHHACLFYRQLFRVRAIDRAFRNTRRGMRLLNKASNAWASGMLVMARQ